MSDSPPAVPNLIDPRSAQPGSASTFLPHLSASGTGETTIGSFRDAKERNATRIALLITWTFALITGLSVVWLGVVVSVYGRAPGVLKGILDSVIPAFKDITLSLTGLFGPLLAFVLGYYFNQKKSE